MKEYTGCIAIANTEHGQLVIPPNEIKSLDPIIWFLDNDDVDEYLNWKSRKMTLSTLLTHLVVQK